MTTAANAPAPEIALEIHICDQRRSYRVTFTGPDAALAGDGGAAPAQCGPGTGRRGPARPRQQRGELMTPRKRKAPDVWLTGPEVAARLGIDPATWRGYVNRGQAPQPDDPDEGRPENRRTPRWLSSTIDRVEAERKVSPMAQSAAAKRAAS